MTKRRLGLFAALLVVFAAGAAYAAIPDSDGVFHACVDKNGDVRIIDHDADENCKDSRQQHVHFNEQGQKGDKGDSGPQGPAGPPGSAASVQGFFAFGSIGPIANASPGHIVVEKAVPTGSYVVTAVVHAILDESMPRPATPKPASSRVTCHVTKAATGTLLASEEVLVPDVSGAPDRPFLGNAQVVLTGVLTADQATSAAVDCDHTDIQSISGYFDAYLTLVKVSSIG